MQQNLVQSIDESRLSKTSLATFSTILTSAKLDINEFNREWKKKHQQEMKELLEALHQIGSKKLFLEQEMRLLRTGVKLFVKPYKLAVYIDFGKFDSCYANSFEQY